MINRPALLILALSWLISSAAYSAEYKVISPREAACLPIAATFAAEELERLFSSKVEIISTSKGLPTKIKVYRNFVPHFFTLNLVVSGRGQEIFRYRSTSLELSLFVTTVVDTGLEQCTLASIETLNAEAGLLKSWLLL